MAKSFSREFEALMAFLRNHAEIEIGDSVTSIPARVRADFYQRFNAVRAAFIEERFPDLLSRARLLQESYFGVETALSDLISWADEPAADPIRTFLRDFGDSLARELFDPLFDLLKGRDSIGDFGQRCSERIAALWPSRYRAAYEKWVLLSIVKQLDPESVLQVESRLLGPAERAKPAAYAPVADVPDPVVSGRLFFNQPENAVFSVPDLIIRSKALGRFVGLRSEFREGMYHALNISGEREWIPVDADLLAALQSGLILLYMAERPEDIALIADVTRFCRPDVVLRCIEAGSRDQGTALAEMEQINGRLRPAQGSFIIADQDRPEAHEMPGSGVQAETMTNVPIRFLNVGLDASRLHPVLQLLAADNAPGMT